MQPIEELNVATLIGMGIPTDNFPRPKKDRSRQTSHVEQSETGPSTSDGSSTFADPSTSARLSTSAPPLPAFQLERFFDIIGSNDLILFGVKRLDRIDAHLNTYDIRMCHIEDHLGITPPCTTSRTSGDDQGSVGASEGDVGQAS